MKETHKRGLSFYDPDQHNPKVTMIGAGGIGSWVALSLAKLGIKHITVYDNDKVEEHNLGTTPYRLSEIGIPKVDALQQVVEIFGFNPVYRGVRRKYTGGTFPKTDILISAVDSMDARRLLFKQAIKQKIPFFIDGRIGGENLRVYAIQPGNLGDRSIYKASLVPNKMVMPLPCTAQQIIDVAFIISGLITRAFRQWVVYKKYNPVIIYKVDVLESIVSKRRRQFCKECAKSVKSLWTEEMLEIFHIAGHPKDLEKEFFSD